MSRMLRLELVGLLLLACTQILTEHRDFYESRSQYGFHSRFQDSPERLTREVRVKQGRLRGIVVQPRTNHDLQSVDVFLGVPYAEPPVGSLRFSPPRSPEPWRGVRQSQEFPPVCPQVVPNLRDEAGKPGRYEYLEKLLPYLKNQSEDCLHLNIYTPHQPEEPRCSDHPLPLEETVEHPMFYCEGREHLRYEALRRAEGGEQRLPANKQMLQKLNRFAKSLFYLRKTSTTESRIGSSSSWLETETPGAKQLLVRTVVRFRRGVVFALTCALISQ